MNMIKYITNKKYGRVGLMYAENCDGQLKVGYSLLNPRDIKEMRKANWELKQANAEAYRQKYFLGKDLPTQPYKPVFNKEVALELARERAKSTLDITQVPKKIQDELENFVYLAKSHLSGKIKMSVEL